MAPRRFPVDSESPKPDFRILGASLPFPNGRKAPNRFLKAAMSELFATFTPEDPINHGLPTDHLINLYQKWGNGRFGVILTGNVQVCPNHLEAPGNAIIFKEGDSEARREAFRRLAKATKEDGGLAIVQLSHGGRQTPLSVNKTPFSASNVQLIKKDQPNGFGAPVALTLSQIQEEVIDRFVYAAKYAYDAGFDGVELHGAHGYLLSQFTSPTTNKRTDRYGGSLENRQRIVMEIFEAIRKEVPSNFIVGLKTNSVEFQAEGTTVEEAVKMCEDYEKAGFDFVELSGGNYEHFAFQHERESTKRREAFFLEFAEKIRPSFKNTVVYVTGGFRTVAAMCEAVTSGATQGIGLGRPATAEPDLPKKILDGSVTSGVYDLLDPNNFFVTLLASYAQMEQMGRRIEISDFSDKEAVDKLNERIGEQMKELQKRAAEGIVKPAIFQL